MKSSLVVSSRRTRPFHLLLLLLPSILLPSLSHPRARVTFSPFSAFPFLRPSSSSSTSVRPSVLFYLCRFAVVGLLSFLFFLSSFLFLRTSCPRDTLFLLSLLIVSLAARSRFLLGPSSSVEDDDSAKIISFECAELITFLRDLQPLR